jgi:hypothetical protein
MEKTNPAGEEAFDRAEKSSALSIIIHQLRHDHNTRCCRTYHEKIKMHPLSMVRLADRPLNSTTINPVR